MIPGHLLDAVAWLSAAAALGAAATAWPMARARKAEDPGGGPGGHHRGRLARAARAEAWLLGAAAGGAACLFVYLASRFLAADLAYQYVFFYTAKDVDWPWRLAGTWAGREGSLLLWAMLLAVASFAMAVLHGRRPAFDATEARARAWTRLVLALLLAGFLAAVASQSAFAPTDPALLQGRPNGNGLNPTLESGFILIHPPMMFAAYALSAIPLAAALGHLASGTDRWSTVALGWGRLGWLLMTFSLGLGAMWAYYTLGFGGYWAWDPVEVANLLPWLAFTVYLHAQLHHKRHGSYGAAGPFLAVLPFLLTLFSTISTRSGLWVSVHAFTDPTETFNPDAAGRFLDILRAEPTLGFHVGLFLATVAVALALWCRRLAADQGRFRGYSRVLAAVLAAFAAYALVAPASAMSGLLELSWQATGGAWGEGGAPGMGLLLVTSVVAAAAALPILVGDGRDGKSQAAGNPRSPERRSRDGPRPAKREARPGLQAIHLRSLLAYSVLALGLALLVLFLFHVASAQRGATAGFYEERFPYLALPVVLGLVVFQGHQAFGRKRSLLVAGAALLAAVALWAAARWQGDYRLAQGLLLGVPALVLAATGFIRIRRAGTPPGTTRNVRRADTLLLAAALLDVLFWLNPPAVRIGLFTWTPTWPAQAVFGALALLALLGAVRNLAGARSHAGPLHLLVGGLAGFYVAAPLALASWVLRRREAGLGRDTARAARDRKGDAKLQGRLHLVALHGLHFAIALALLGYAPSTYLKAEADLELGQGDAAVVAGHVLTFTATHVDSPDGLPADIVQPTFRVARAATPEATVAGQLRWEQAAGAYFPLPSTVRSWHGDLYVDVESVHVAAGAACLPAHPDGAWVEAYRAGLPRLCAGDSIDRVRMHAAVLPGLGLLWLALAVGVASMALLMATQAGGGPARTASRPET